MSNFFYGIANAAAVAAHQRLVVASVADAAVEQAAAVVKHRTRVEAERIRVRAAKGLKLEGKVK